MIFGFACPFAECITCPNNQFIIDVFPDKYTLTWSEFSFNTSLTKTEIKLVSEIWLKSCEDIISSSVIFDSNNLANINFGEYVRTLTAQLFDSFPARPSVVRLNMNVADIFLEVNKAISCALMINELVTNAIKYGFPKSYNREGEVKVELIYADEGKVTLIVADNGVGLPESFDIGSSKTLGMQIIKALVKKLRGTIAVDRSEGTKFFVQFPMKE